MSPRRCTSSSWVSVKGSIFQIFPSFPSHFLQKTLAPILGLLKRVLNLVVFSKPDLLPLLRHCMLHESLPRMLRHKLPDETWIPELTGYTKIFTAAHQSVGLTPFSCCRDTLRRKIILFSTSDGHKPIKENEA